MLRVGIYGASGYTGQELLRLLLRHPRAEVVALTSRQFRGMPVHHVYPAFRGLTDLRYIDASAEDVADLADFVFLAVPHGEAMEVAPFFLEAGKKVVDLSADFRLRDPSLYEKWYGNIRPPSSSVSPSTASPSCTGRRSRRRGSSPTPAVTPLSVILGLAPLLKGGLIDGDTVIADSKSGVSGAGRETKVGSLFCEVNEGFKPYNVFKHRHNPEMEQELGVLAGRPINLSFTPHLLPLDRGILSSVYATLYDEMTVSDLLDLYLGFYDGEKFVRVCREGSYPDVAAVRGSNYCDIGMTVDERLRRVVVFSAIDNLIKGASGQAVQNMNLMCGFREDEGIDLVPLFP